MHFIEQKESNKCLAACICSFFQQLNIDSFPDYLSSSNWWRCVSDYVLSTTGYGMMQITMPENEYPLGHYIVVGKSQVIPDGDHAVIYKKGSMVFDPSTHKKGIKGTPKYYIIFYRVFY